MSNDSAVTLIGTTHQQRTNVARRFRACMGRFGDAADRTTIDELAKWIERRFEQELQERPSKHVYVRLLPSEVVSQVDQLRDSAMIHSLILEQFAPNSVITAMKHTDELYISHYNQDFGGDHGLFARHYDGNLRFLPFASVVRALIYLQSDSNYKVVFGDSKIERAFTTYEFGLLDFHRELHWVEGDYKPSDRRILLKCNYLICPGNAGFLKKAVLSLNTGVFYVVKAAMEYSKSPKTPLQVFTGLLCNLVRLMNNVHPLIPLAFVALILVAMVWGCLHLLMS